MGRGTSRQLGHEEVSRGPATPARINNTNRLRRDCCRIYCNPVEEEIADFIYETESEDGDRTVHAHALDGRIIWIIIPNRAKLAELKKASSDEKKQEYYSEWLRRRGKSTKGEHNNKYDFMRVKAKTLKIYILGAGGMARETLDVLIDLGREREVLGFLEDDCKRVGTLLNGKRVDDVSILKIEKKRGVKLLGAIGTPLRRQLVERTKAMGYGYDTVVHPSVVMSRWVSFGEGCIICAGSKLTTQVEVENHVIVNLNCTVSHDVRIGSYSTISPGVNISGRVTIGSGCFVGANASIREGVKIGDNVLVAAGAAVTRDISDNTLVTGVPAVPKRHLDQAAWRRLF